jgi:hypothetical protein
MLSLHFGPKVHLDVILQLQPHEMKREEERIKQARKNETHRTSSEQRERGKMEAFKNFSADFMIPN